MEKNVQLKYRLFRRRNGVFYWQENDSSKQGTLRTSERREADRLLYAINESDREPTLNLNLARAYLAAHDPMHPVSAITADRSVFPREVLGNNR